MSGWAPVPPPDPQHDPRQDPGRTPGHVPLPPPPPDQGGGGWAPPPSPPPPGGGWGGGQGYGGQGWGQPGGYGPAPAGGPLPLRPLGFGDVLDGAFTLYRRSWRTLAIAAGAVLVPVQVLANYLQRDLLTFAGMAALMEGDVGNPAGLGLGGLAQALVVPFVAGVAAIVCAESYLGRDPEPGPALGRAGRRFLPLVAAWLLTHVVQLVGLIAGMALVGVGAAMGATGSIAVGVLLMLAGIPVALGLMALFMAVAPAIVVEDLGPVTAIKRSVALLRPRLMATLGIAVVSGLLASFVGQVLSMVPSALAGAVGELGWVLAALGGILAGIVTTPLVAIVATLVYFDARIRHEGFDLQLMAADLDRPR